MDIFITAALTFVSSVAASSGFWAFMMKRMERSDTENEKNVAVQKLLLGLAHDRIVTLGTEFIHRGYVTYSEYEDLNKYLFSPYSTFGGNGTAEKIMRDVKELPMRRFLLPVDDKRK